MSSLPRITIVTPSYNQGQYLQETILSVIGQDYPNLEYYVMDGGSTDGSVEIIKKYAAHLSGWVSEKDEGQTDAVVKGLTRGGGVLMNWLNSDDILLPGALRCIAETYMSTNADIIVGEDIQFKKEPCEIVGHFKPDGYTFPSCVRFWTGEFSFHQPPTYFTHSVYHKVGGLNAKLHYVMDYDLYCRMLAEQDVETAYVSNVLTGFRVHKEAKTVVGKMPWLDELRVVSKQYWQVAELTKNDKKEMDRVSAIWSVHHTYEAFKRKKVGAALRGLYRVFRYSPVSALKYCVATLRG